VLTRFSVWVLIFTSRVTIIWWARHDLASTRCWGDWEYWHLGSQSFICNHPVRISTVRLTLSNDSWILCHNIPSYHTSDYSLAVEGIRESEKCGWTWECTLFVNSRTRKIDSQSLQVDINRTGNKEKGVLWDPPVPRGQCYVFEVGYHVQKQGHVIKT